MTDYAPGFVLAAVGAAFMLLGAWGRGKAEVLVSVAVSAERRTKEMRTIRRGARSCLLFGAFSLINGVVFVVVASTR